MQRVSEKLPTPIRRYAERYVAQNDGDLWAPLPMCIATQKNCKVVKTKCPSIFIHTMCFSHQCMVYDVHKVCLFLYHSFWITLYNTLTSNATVLIFIFRDVLYDQID